MRWVVNHDCHDVGMMRMMGALLFGISALMGWQCIPRSLRIAPPYASEGGELLPLIKQIPLRGAQGG